MGDPNGIGPEISLKAAVRLGDDLDVMLVGDRNVFKEHARVLDIAIERFEIREPSPPVTPEFIINFGLISAAAGTRSMEAVRTAAELCLDGTVDAMATAPISKEAIAKAGYPFPGHTEFLASLANRTAQLMLMVADGLRVAVATVHVPLRRVPDLLTQELLVNQLELLAASLRHDFGIRKPKIAVLGLNPHAGDGGVLGGEEQEVIVPAMAQIDASVATLSGPFPADGFFGNRSYKQFDGIMATYHDQGLIPFKTLSFNRGCNFTAGLPLIRVSPDHGTAFDIAGKGSASEDSLVAAINVARQIIEARR